MLGSVAGYEVGESSVGDSRKVMEAKRFQGWEALETIIVEIVGIE